MRKIFSLVMVTLLSVGTSMACMKKAPAASSVAPGASTVTILVMDTSQALLQGAEVEIGKTVYRTSWDGRVVLKPEQTANAKRMTIVCEGHESCKMPIEKVPLIEVRLTPKPRKTPTGHTLARGGAVYKTFAATAECMAMDDGAAPRILPAAYSGGAPNYAATAGQLTAGEVNDFTKWPLWPKVMDGSHKQYVSTWRIAPRERYTVQVMNKEGYPIANHPVSLTDMNGNTVFQAVTDNTGKAELWNGLLTEQGEKAVVKVPEKTIILDEPCEAQDGADVVFVFDATGSMGDELRYLQAEMKDVIARASEATGGLKIRTGAVVYRDHSDEYVTRISRLTEDITTTQAFIDKQEASGGGDYPEAVPEALMAALNSAGWDASARTRIAFLILDAPCHEDSATLALLHEQILNAAALGVRIVPVVCSGLGESGEYLLRSIALATNGTSFFLTDDSGIGNPHLKPTTDSIKVEHLNDMLVRTIVEFSYMPACAGQQEAETEHVQEAFIPNPFSAQDIANEPSLPHGPTTLYLLDVSGKLITIYEGILEEAGQAQLSAHAIYLPTGIYFVKAFYDGEWHTKKIPVR